MTLCGILAQASLRRCLKSSLTSDANERPVCCSCILSVAGFSSGLLGGLNSGDVNWSFPFLIQQLNCLLSAMSRCAVPAELVSYSLHQSVRRLFISELCLEIIISAFWQCIPFQQIKILRQKSILLNATYTMDPVITWMGNCLRTGKPSRYATKHLGQLSFPSFRGR